MPADLLPQLSDSALFLTLRRLYESDGHDDAALTDLVARMSWKIYNPRVREALRTRLQDQGVTYAVAKRNALLSALPRVVVAARTREREVRWGRTEWMYDDEERRARVIPEELHHVRYFEWLQRQTIALAEQDLLLDSDTLLPDPMPLGLRSAASDLLTVIHVPEDAVRLAQLSPQEQRLFDLLRAKPDATKRELAADLGTTRGTVTTTLKRLRRKLGLP